MNPASIPRETTIVSLDQINIRLRYVVKRKPANCSNVIAFPKRASQQQKD